MLPIRLIHYTSTKNLRCFVTHMVARRMDQWTFVIGELIKVKKPDGYVEVQQITFESLEGTAGSKFLNSRHVKSWHVKCRNEFAPSLLSTNLCYFNLITNNISMDELKQLV
ncbi:hypothetical protein RhiirC2_798393 [Rhizophagus irregularis]|uniref:Uncharacterized protein n=1 Tax=Rhizophagus irregularis TaxID=588596 RepID=A0A2N1M6K1_9GLOM|nr:hypothetical protein RhiirC2_798393 [Rhizophagus irregularis]